MVRERTSEDDLTAEAAIIVFALRQQTLNTRIQLLVICEPAEEAERNGNDTVG